MFDHVIREDPLDAPAETSDEADVFQMSEPVKCVLACEPDVEFVTMMIKDFIGRCTIPEGSSNSFL